MRVTTRIRETIREEPAAVAAVLLWMILTGLYWGYTVLGPYLFGAAQR